MKKLAIIAVAGLALVSAAAYAQMQHGPGDRQPMQHNEHGMMGPGRMHGPMMHGAMMHGHMMPGHSTHGTTPGSHTAQPKGDTGPSSLAFHGINAKMHGAMDIAFTGNTDVDFVKGMIPHHQGAVDMAKTVLAFGKDPEVRKLAEEIIRSQESEIALMQEWLKKNGR
jgi:uncharacterized protein (DUF305 family)